MSQPDPFKPTGTLSHLFLHPEEFMHWAFEKLSTLVSSVANPLLVALVVVAVAAVAPRALSWLRDRRLSNLGRWVRVIPAPVSDVKSAQVFWMGMLSLLRPWWRRILFGQPYLVWQVAGKHEEIGISVWIPRQVPPGMVERAIEAAWPGSRTELEEQGVELGGAIAACDLGLAAPDWYPLGTGPDSDPLKLALSSLTSLSADEQCLIQVLARPTVSSSRRRLLRAASAMRLGVDPGPLSRMKKRQQGNPRPPQDPWVEGEVKATLHKASSPLYQTLVRVASSAPEKPIARGRVHSLAGAFAIFEGRNGFRRRRSLLSSHRLPRKTLVHPYLLSVPELSLIATLPAAGAVPGLERAGAQPVAPASAVRTEGKVLGISDWSVGERAVAISIADSRHHIHLVGETGTGKSTLIANLVLEDAAAGRAAVVIDPKGDLVESILERLPQGAEERTCLLDPEDDEWAVGLDPLRGPDEDLVVDQITGAFKRIYEHHWGPRTDFLMRICLLTLRQIPGATLTETSLLLMNYEWRRAIRDRIRHISILSEFWGWFDRMNENSRSEYAQSLLNKLGSFDLRGRLRLIVGQSKPRRNIETLIDTGGLLLVRIPKGTLGEDTSRLMGALVIARVWQTCMKRASRDESERPDATLYVDEMHNYLALPRSFQDLLAEARGYRLSMVLAHQHMGQLPREMREALAANARTKVCFAISPEDALPMERHFAPELSAYDLSHLAAFQGACRPCVDGSHGRSFTFRTKPLSPGSKSRAEEVRAATHAQFARRAETVEEEIRRRHRDPAKILLPQPPGARRRYGEHHGERYPERYGEQPLARGVEETEMAGGEAS